MKSIAKLHYITQDHPEYSHEDLVVRACNANIKWIQLRIKNRPENELFSIAQKCNDICKQHHVTFIINDHVAIAKELDLDGVHLGLNDMPVHLAREILGKEKLIGGTANTLEDIRLHESRGADYVGVGPFRFTKTKENLSPVLGLNGYKKLVTQSAQLPIIAIGGITQNDIQSILNVGVHGVALASEITFAKNMKSKILELRNELT